jgi:hypothetical protein
MALQRFAHSLGEHAAPAEGDHSVGCRVAQQPAHELLLQRPERLLAVELELARDRMAELALQQRVAVERLSAERRGELDSRCRLAGAHEADQDECHPIRSV